MNDKNTIVMGLLFGAVTPVIGFVVFESIFEGLEMVGLIEEATSSAMDRRERTISLLAICSNLIPFNFAKKRRWDQMLRGVVFPTLIYVAAWIYRYHDILF
ncbi:MAG: hypothetical protein HKN68_08830 [Saprospiraceae bacterium]|nr:hypothetical protein [Saprospiraceae bacterium]